MEKDQHTFNKSKKTSKKEIEEEQPKTTPNTKAIAMTEKIKKRNVADLFTNNTQEDPPNQ